MKQELTMNELVQFVERLGEELGWSTRYIDLAVTTTAAVFRSLNADEDSDAIPIGTAHIPVQLKTLEHDLRTRGRTPSTIATYVTTWKRLSSVADGWVLVRGTPEENVFWNDIERFRDNRPTRRNTAGEKRSNSDLASDASSQSWERIEIPLDDGVAVVVLPHKLSQSEAYRIINAVMAAGAVDST